MDLKQEFADLICCLHTLGHTPATGGNFSFYLPDEQKVWISESAVDKSKFTEKNWIALNLEGELLKGFEERKSSDETDLHLAIYKNTEARVVLHSHHINFVLASEWCENSIELKGQELIKAISGQKTHETILPIPCFENTQEIKSLSEKLFPHTQMQKAHAFLLKNHGLTVWGRSLFEAKRHLEAYTYLIEIENSKRNT